MASGTDDPELIRRFYAATNGGQHREATSYWADDVEVRVPASSGPLAGTFRGRKSVVGWFEDWFKSFDDVRFDVTETTELGEGRVLVVADQHGRGRSSGLPVGTRVVWVYELREGRITRAELFSSRSRALRSVEDRG